MDEGVIREKLKVTRRGEEMVRGRWKEMGV